MFTFGATNPVLDPGLCSLAAVRDLTDVRCLSSLLYIDHRHLKRTERHLSFFSRNSHLLETVTVAPGHLLLTGDLNFHMESPGDCYAASFRELLESAGLKQHVIGPTHRSGHLGSHH